MTGRGQSIDIRAETSLIPTTGGKSVAHQADDCNQVEQDENADCAVAETRCLPIFRLRFTNKGRLRGARTSSSFSFVFLRRRGLTSSVPSCLIQASWVCGPRMHWREDDNFFHLWKCAPQKN